MATELKKKQNEIDVLRKSQRTQLKFLEKYKSRLTALVKAFEDSKSTFSKKKNDVDEKTSKSNDVVETSKSHDVDETSESLDVKKVGDNPKNKNLEKQLNVLQDGNKSLRMSLVSQETVLRDKDSIIEALEKKKSVISNSMKSKERMLKTQMISLKKENELLTSEIVKMDEDAKTKEKEFKNEIFALKKNVFSLEEECQNLKKKEKELKDDIFYLKKR